MRFRDSRGHTNYEIPVSNGLLTPEHVKRMGDAVWLELLLEDMVTDGDGDDGVVLGGSPVRDRELAERLGKSQKTIARYRDTLDGTYIVATFAGTGYTYRVLKSKKWAMLRRLWVDKSVHPCTPRVDTSVHPRVDMIGSKGGQNRQPSAIASLMTSSGHSQKRQQQQEAAANFQNLEPWKAIGLDTPVGDPVFQRSWETTWANRDGQLVSQVMGMCADSWEAKGEKVPPPFFRAKAEVRQREREKEGKKIAASVLKVTSTRISDEDAEAMGVFR